MGRTMVAAFAAAWLLSFTTVAQSDSLTPAEIEAAIKWGASGNAAPYLLHHAAQPGTTRDVVVGAVYTPFVRVALVAKAASDGGQHLTTEDVPSPLAEPVELSSTGAIRLQGRDTGSNLELGTSHPRPPAVGQTGPGDVECAWRDSVF